MMRELLLKALEKILSPQPSEWKKVVVVPVCLVDSPGYVEEKKAFEDAGYTIVISQDAK